MMIKSYIFLALLPALAIGCAGPQKKDRGMEELNARINDLSASLVDSRERFDELSAKFYLLQEKLEAARPAPAPERDIVEEEISVPEAPPEGLKVVSLPEHGNIAVPALKKEPAPPAVISEKKEGRTGAKSSLNKKAQTPEEMYERGQLLFSSGRYIDARSAFMELADLHPGHDLADNAIYWAGEAYYSEKDFTSALARFQEVADRYPERNKAPDALLKVGYSYFEISDTVMARESLAELVRKYPESDAAGKARRALAGLSAQ
ncbi:MAG: tol-pal system protein YbgF [Deltaproteobacteria bacterium RBG_19FT_COMBO_58_16]|nr:MAG: tol-pal system protein YbgF [Deltaproteobacteria bacterium RBG_19FT_COMBO_58_16]